MDKFLVRLLRESDRAYICRTILFSMIELDSHTKRINRDSFLQSHNKIINSILNRAQCLVICDPQEEGLLYGFIICEQMGDFDVIHFAYTRKDFRGLGLLKGLIPQVCTKDSVAISHINNNIGPARLKQFWKKVIYDPYLTLL